MIQESRIAELARLMPDVSVTVTLSDLMAAARELAARVRKDAEEQTLQKIKNRASLMTRQEASQILHVSEPTILRWERRGLVKVKEIGGRRMYDRRDIYNLINTNS